MLMAIVNNPNDSKIKGKEIVFRIGFRIALKIAKIKLAKSNIFQPPVIIKPGKKVFAKYKAKTLAVTLAIIRNIKI